MNLTKSYFLEFTIFDQKIKYKLELDDLRKNKKYLILPVNKIKLFYFFCDGRKNLTEFLENQKVKLNI